jgi:hypothetical protein
LWFHPQIRFQTSVPQSQDMVIKSVDNHLIVNWILLFVHWQLNFKHHVCVWAGEIYSINKMVIEIHMLTPKLSILNCEILWLPITIENIGQNDQNNCNITEIWLPIIYQNHFTNDKNIWQRNQEGTQQKAFKFLLKAMLSHSKCIFNCVNLGSNVKHFW